MSVVPPRAVTRPSRLVAGGVVAGAVALTFGLGVAPPDAVQGEAQRLMYLHVPAAWCAYLCFAVVLVANLRYLARRTARSDAVARSAGEVGVVLTAATLVTGSLWGALTWGTWWVWDARIASTVALGLVYVVYLSARSLAAGPRTRAVAAVLGVGGFVMVPVVHFSVLWWRTVHQPPTILAPGTGLPIDTRMALALSAALLAGTLLTVGAVRHRSAAHLSPDRTPDVQRGPDAAPGADRPPEEARHGEPRPDVVMPAGP